MCLLGSSLFPFSKVFVNYYQNLMSGSCKQNFQSITKDDQILLLLRYPKNFTLASRSIIGEMKSLNPKTDPKYFDKVHISSHLHNSKYHFVSNQLVSKACNPYPYQDETIDEEVRIFQGSQFCKVIQSFGSETFDIGPVSDYNGSRNNFGPFSTEGRSDMIGKYSLSMTNLNCIRGEGINKLKSAKVSAVFRLLSPLEDRMHAGSRTGLSGMTISAEGIWNSSSGQLCMIGCLGMETGESGCNSRICLYFPMIFSVTQRSIVTGTISDIKKTDAFTTLYFKKELHPLDLWNRYDKYSKSYLSYKYSKIEMANTLLKRNKNLDVFGVLYKKMLKYLDIENRNNKTELSSLATKLELSSSALPNNFLKTPLSETTIRLQVLSLGPLFGRFWSWSREEKRSCEEKDDIFNAGSYSNTLPLNISGQLSITGESYNHISEIFVEGLYVPSEGKMYLIGCRKMKYFEKKMDCLIEVKVEYSSKNIRWLLNQNAKVSIASQREKQDPLYFSPISLTTALIPYQDNQEDTNFRHDFESSFRILMLLASIACFYSQISYIRNKVSVVPFISLTMLGIQVLSYVLPLIIDSSIIIKWKEYNYQDSYITHRFRSYNTWAQNTLQDSTKILVLITFVFALRLSQKVLKSRGSGHKPKNLKVKPTEKQVIFLTLVVHMFGYMAIFVRSNTKAGFTSELEKYMNLVQDLFLLPQVIGNIIWDTKQVKALSKMYYLGFSVLRLIIRGYDCIREPVFDYYSHKNTSTMGSEFFSKYEGMWIMTSVAVLAIVVHVQQMN